MLSTVSYYANDILATIQPWVFVYISGGYQVVLVDPGLIKSVTVKNAHKFKRPDLVAKIVPSGNKGLFSSNGKAHSRQKRMISPAFSSANVRRFLEIFQENTGRLLEVNKPK